MEHLIDSTLEARLWADLQMASFENDKRFGCIKAAVLWTSDVGVDGNLLVPVAPLSIVSEINNDGMDLLKGHDPGAPLGRMLSAATFDAPDGRRFIAGILGLYDGSNIDGFDALGVSPTIEQLPDFSLGALRPDHWIQFSVDPREVSHSWIDDVLLGAPIRVERQDLSHNAADVIQELVRIGLPYVAVVWNPFVKVIATEAGKDTYAALKTWLRALLRKCSELNSPIVDVVSHLGECQISFLFRGNDIKKTYAAHECLSLAAQKAAALVKNMQASGLLPVKVTYEFHHDHELWYPSFAVLQDGSLITDNVQLISAEQLPQGLSLGLSISRD